MTSKDKQAFPYGFVANLRVQQRAGYDKKLQNMTFRVLALLVTYADKNGFCFPSISKMAQRLGIKRQAVQTQIRKLEKHGYLKTFQQYNKPNTYQILRMPADCPHTQPDNIAPPATLLDCTKKPPKRPEKETISTKKALKDRKRDYLQEKHRESETGISKADEAALADIAQKAWQGMGLMARIDLDLNLKDAARKLFSSKKEQHDYLRRRYTEICEDNHRAKNPS